MNLKKLLFTASLLLPLAANAQSITPAQIEQFKSLPKVQQEALASQYGIDLDSLQSSGQQNQRPRAVQVVEPVPNTPEAVAYTHLTLPKKREGWRSVVGAT